MTVTPLTAAPTVSSTAMPIESGVPVLITWISPKYVPADNDDGFTPTSSVAVPPADTLPLEVNGISQLLPLCVLATTLKSRFCPLALIDTGIVEGLPSADPVAAVKFSVDGLAVSSVTPPTVIVAITVAGVAPLPCGMIWNEVSYVPGPSPAALAVATIGVADPAIRFKGPDGFSFSHEAVFAVFNDTIPEPLAVT